ncbi:hypothetical protein CDAR_227771 [Caerostris darwini]|uniref:Uncharacterized protein n=1 Tax=Caerostris darwini TaxID=1538125 RepID=A0AAV4WK77_9ARAC|nr:hypothetical protein CDAR_227771 [Caerostris darwini]
MYSKSGLKFLDITNCKNWLEILLIGNDLNKETILTTACVYSAGKTDNASQAYCDPCYSMLYGDGSYKALTNHAQTSTHIQNALKKRDTNLSYCQRHKKEVALLMEIFCVYKLRIIEWI